MGRLRKLVYAVITISMLLAAGEILGRAFGPAAPRNPATAGLPLPPKAKGAHRILVFGGSAAFGWPVSEYGFAEQLVFMLRRSLPGSAIELQNLAQPGKDSTVAADRLALAIESEPDLLIVAAFDNDFIAWHPSLGRDGWVENALRWSGLARVIHRLAKPRKKDDHTRQERMYSAIPPLTPDDPVRAELLDIARDNVRAMAGIARNSKVPLLMLTGASSLADWPPVNINLRGERYGDSWRRRIDAVRAALARGEAPAALAMASSALTEFPDDAMLLFLQGRAHLLGGEIEAARHCFLRARDLDPYPCRVTGGLSDVIRTIGAEGDATVVDVEALLTAAAPNGLVGRDLVADNCHPTLLGHHFIARRLFEEITTKSLLKGATNAGGAVPLAEYENHLREKGVADRLALLHAVVTAQWSLSLPFVHLELARTWLLDAEARSPEDAAVIATRAAEALLSGRTDEGVGLLRRSCEPGRKAVTKVDLQNAELFRQAFRKAGLSGADFR